MNDKELTLKIIIGEIKNCQPNNRDEYTNNLYDNFSQINSMYMYDVRYQMINEMLFNIYIKNNTYLDLLELIKNIETNQ